MHLLFRLIIGFALLGLIVVSLLSVLSSLLSSVSRDSFPQLSDPDDLEFENERSEARNKNDGAFS
jgi:hypothetical protein